MLIVDHDADVNLPMKDGTTPVHCAVDRDREGGCELLMGYRCYGTPVCYGQRRWVLVIAGV